MDHPVYVESDNDAGGNDFKVLWHLLVQQNYKYYKGWIFNIIFKL